MKFLDDISNEECRSRFVRYEFKEKLGPRGPYVLHSMAGLAGTNTRTVHLSHGHKRFEETATSVPACYRMDKKYDKSWAHEYHCREPNPIPTQGKDVLDWVDTAHDKYLTIGDVQRLKHGQKLSLSVLDRNLMDRLSTITPNKPMKATTLLAPTRATYIHDKGVRGKLVTADGIVADPFEFHVAVPGGWYPLENDMLPAKDPQGFIKLYGVAKSVECMPLNTYLGYRGPMIPWSVVTRAPKMYWYQE